MCRSSVDLHVRTDYSRLPVVLAVLAVGVFGVDSLRASPEPSRWMDPVNEWRSHVGVPPGPPIGHAEIRQETTVAPGRMPLTWDRGRVGIMVESGIYGGISDALSDYSADLAEIGFSSTVITVSGTAEYLRNTLITMYNEPDSLAGAVLIGDLPYVIFEMDVLWGYTNFACDFYYMDMDGVWADDLTSPPFQSGLLDTWSGDQYVEIWVSRMKTDDLPGIGSEVDLLNGFFARNHTARWDLLNNLHVGLVYPDDDWAEDGVPDTLSLESLFGDGNVVTVDDPEATTAADYIDQRLTANYQLDMIRSHGSPYGHGFYRENRTIFDYVLPDDYTFHDPDASLFSLFVCSGCDYTYTDYLGGTVVFNLEGNGLLAWGSTKTGGMLHDHFMYEQIARGECIGEGFKDWFNAVRDYVYAPDWFYGMVLVGDGSLCEYPVDCNNNFIADESEVPVACGGSCTEGCDPDCNCNGMPDACDEPDCNDNDVPDECEIPVSSGGLCTEDCDPDCNGNAIPDSCEPDCNDNDVPDDCDIVGGTSDDCNTNGLPDDCEITGGGGIMWAENFEAGLPGGWSISGTFQLTNECAQSHPTCGGALWPYAGHTDTCTYGDEELGELVAPPVTLGWGVSELSFCSRLETEEHWDFGRVLVNGVTAWEESGGMGIWEERVVDLHAFAGETVTITFQMTSDSSISGTFGWAMDNAQLYSENLDCNGNTIPDECDIAEGTSPDLDGNGIPDECDSASRPLPEDSLGRSCALDEDCDEEARCVQGVCYAPKHRYLSVRRNLNQTTATARRIKLDTGEIVGWVGEPQYMPPSSQHDGLWLAELAEAPHYEDPWPNLLHVTGCGIGHAALCSDSGGHCGPNNCPPGESCILHSYHVQAIQIGKDIGNEGLYSAPLALHTPSVWGDTVSTCAGNVCKPANGIVGLDDVQAAIKLYQGSPVAPITWLDIDPSNGSQLPNQNIGVGDILKVIDGFQGQPYPGDGPLNCP